MCVISCVHRMVVVLKRGPWRLYLFKLYQKKSPYILRLLYRNFIHGNQLILSGNLLLRENSYHIANCLKSFNFELFFVCQLKFSMGSLVHLHTMFLYLEKSMTYFRAY